MHRGLFVDRGWRRPDLDSFAFSVVIGRLAELGDPGHDLNYISNHPASDIPCSG